MEGPACLIVVLFSKDRPYQLASCLGSLLRSLTGASLHVCVLYKASTAAFSESYSLIQRLFAAEPREAGLSPFQLQWEEETAEQPLGCLLDLALERGDALGASGLLFTVDDALFFSSFDVKAALRMLAAEPTVYAVHAKLCPRVEFAHPNSKFMRLPKFSATGAEPSLLLFDLGQGEYDWNYPWELSASIYRLADVRSMLAAIREHFGEEGVNHPNLLEGYGVRLFKQRKIASLAERAKKCVCSAHPTVAVVTINKVQALFDNPVYGAPVVQGNGLSEVSPKALDLCLRHICYLAAKSLAITKNTAPEEAMAEQTGLAAAWFLHYWESASPPVSSCGCEASGSALLTSPPRAILPLDPYHLSYLDSVHVPLLTVAPPSPQLSGPNPVVSWLLPVFNAPADWLREACDSIFCQSSMGPGSWELVLVDDGSDNEETLTALAELARKPQVRVQRQEQQAGIARALNEGWKVCRGDYVARLDADDIAAAERLSLQLAFLEAHPSIAILGGGFRTFQKLQELQSGSRLAASRRYRMQCHPLLTRWHMLFSCSLAHPTVTFRRRALETAAGPYPEGEEAEDHCCWLAQPLSVQMANIADVVSYLRRHPGSRSAGAAAALRRSSHEALRRFLFAHCQEAVAKLDLTEADMALLCDSTEAASSEQVQRAAKALDAAEAFFLETADACGVEFPAGFQEDFLGPRTAAVKEYIRSSCSKLRGAVTVQALAAGDLSSGAEMMKHWLKGGDAGLKSLGALINAGFTGQGSGAS